MTQFCFIDIETTGISQEDDFILEIGAILIDENLEPATGAPSFHTVVQYKGDPGVYEDVVIAMHTKSGLWNECAASTVKGWTAIRMFQDWCEFYIKDKDNTYATGNNIKFDLNFLWSNGFSYETYMHYCSVDISSVKVLTNTWIDEDVLKLKPESKKLHRSIPDIYDSITELAWYKEQLWIY
jgi:oligoribonuclease